MKKHPLPSPTFTTPASSFAADLGTPSSPTTSPSSSRPVLQRQVRSTPQHRSPREEEGDGNEETTDEDVSDSGAEEQRHDHVGTGESAAGAVHEPPRETSSPEELELERLRSLQLKAIQLQQRARAKAPNANTIAGLGPRRVSPIKEEPISTMSPTLENAFVSPLPTAQTASTESTESARTIRGSMPPTPAVRALRTPSYPFPTVPGTPLQWSSSFHQPFTALSPTVSAIPRKESRPKERVASESSTPVASQTPMFAPRDATVQSPTFDDPRFPSPNLYDLVLQLNSESGLTAWWETVTSIMRDWYCMERATLAVPADASDIENVPWGQKTTFNTHAPKEENTRPTTFADPASRDQQKLTWQTRAPEPSTPAESLPSTPIPERRPKLPSRHSVAGHERQRRDLGRESPSSPQATRPRGPIRTASHAPQQTGKSEHPLRQVSPASFDGAATSQPMATPLKEHSFSDLDFSSIADSEAVSPTTVFPVLRALDHERDALIDNLGISRVLERGRLVTLTRDYATASTNTEAGSKERAVDDRNMSSDQQPFHQSLRSLSTRAGYLGHGPSDSQPHYEEYEQFPSSPWSQSPAPSPAIQNDPGENPFFASPNVDDDTFNPSASSQDYTQYGQVEAIGVDSASTIMHIPLVHPVLSQPMQPTQSRATSRSSTMDQQHSDQTTPMGFPPDVDKPRRAPIAILSILCPIVPYPRNLTNSIKLIGPHLATSFSTAWQFTSAQGQGSGVRQRRWMAEQQVGSLPVRESENIESLLHLNIENISQSTGGSVTSPSDYSSKSRLSPGGSITGTPGWDLSGTGFSSKHSVGSTPGHLGGNEVIESYFDAKKKSVRMSSQTSSSSQEKSKKIEKKPSKRSSVNTVPEAPEDDATSMRRGLGNLEDTPESRKLLTTQTTDSQSRSHSLLHSYGADFTSSFQSLPAATTPGARTPAPTGVHARSGSIPDIHEVNMPPPSENLLRTIIDSLPVQIFTALPTTGALTWVNSKFLIYRGEESQQVLQGPWDAIHPEDRDSYLEQWNKSLRTGQQLQKKVRLRRFDDCYRWFYVRVAPLRNKRQQIVHWIGTNMDFHEQHLAEMNSARQQETAASEAKYRALANSSPQVVFVVSDRRGLTFCNTQWETYSGQTEAQARGNGFLEHVHPEDIVKCKLPEMTEDGSTATNVPTSMATPSSRQNSSSSDSSSDTEKGLVSPTSTSPDRLDLPQSELSKLASTGILRAVKDADGRASYSTEVRLRNKDGDFRWHLVRILLEKSLAEDGIEETWYGTATDINDHKLLEQTLKETMDAKTRFLSNMSHEIRTPLNGISGMVNFLLDSPLSGEQLEHVNIIKASTDSLLSLINDILDLSKVEAGMIKLTMEWMHLPSLLEEVNDLNMGLAIQKGLELNYLMEEGVPSMVKGDKFRIRQVLLNVVGNAIKFTERGEIFVRCSLQKTGGVASNETVVRFEVIDTGRGFTEQEAKYLFKRFSQIDASSTRQHGGTGLGLAISLQFVELHGGTMNAHSVAGAGSTFFFTIKFGLPTGDDHPKPPATTPGTPATELSTVVPPFPLSQPAQRSPNLPTAAVARLERQSSASSERTDSLKSPVPSLTASERTRDSPSLSSGSSDHSLTGAALIGRSGLRSERSSVSSFLNEVTHVQDIDMTLALPIRRMSSKADNRSDESLLSLGSDETVLAQGRVPSVSPLEKPPMFSILVVCPLLHSREATIRHIKNTLPSGIPHQVTGQSSLLEAQRMIGGDDPVLFTHVVLVLHQTHQVIAIMDQILNSPVHSSTAIVVVSDPAQKRELMKEAPAWDYESLLIERRLQFIYRPLKPSKFAAIFDPQKEREFSTDRNQDTAQQVVFNQKLVFEDLKKRLGGKGHKVLLVEDNHINQTVILKFLARISVDTETVLDGVQCTDAVFSKPAGYYSIILCDLHMPNKDGYQACKEIRRWEKKHLYRRHPIIALSANVLGDVYAKCVEAGFNSYVTKPVEFKELSIVLARFLDPKEGEAKSKGGPELMKLKR